MKLNEVLSRIESLDESKIIISDIIISKRYNKISLFYNGVRILDLSRPQFEKLKKMGYKHETFIYE
jgi:hypothetical protein